MSRMFLFVLFALLGTAETARAAPHRTVPHEVAVSGVVNLNTASETELRVLPGIGPAKAQRILAQRAKHRFDSTDQLMRVKGIGRKTYRKLKPYLTLSGPTTIARKKPAHRDEIDVEPVAPLPAEAAVPPVGG